MTDIPEIAHIAPLAPSSDVWFVDIWGVMHNGVRPYETAVAACQTFRASGGRVLLVSNSPRPRAGVIAQLDHIGVARDAYDDAITSGDVSRTLICDHAGETVWHVGPQRDVAIFQGIDVVRGEPEDAMAVVCTGLFDDETETANDYDARFAPLAARGVPMICANPDLTVARGGRIIPCAGALAVRYRELGGPVALAGKPYQPIYDAALAWVSSGDARDADRTRILAIGDGAGTDIEGAATAGVRAVFVQSPVSVRRGETLSEAATRLFAGKSGAPVAVMAELAW